MELVEKHYSLPEGDEGKELFLEMLRNAGYSIEGRRSFVHKKPILEHTIYRGNYKNMKWKQRLDAEAGTIQFDWGEVVVRINRQHGSDLDKLLARFEPKDISAKAS